MSLHQYDSVAEGHSFVEARFESFFLNQGYREHPSMPLISEGDESVIFTGASISAVKDLVISERIGHPGLYIIQPVIRTQDFRSAFSNEFVPLGQTFFHMATVHAPAGSYNRVCAEAIEFAVHGLGVSPSRLMVKTTSSDPELTSYWKDVTGIKVEYDSNKPNYYVWEYGVEGVLGSGITISLYNPTTKSYWDVGNIVILRDPTGREIGVEFGYGIEFFLTALTSTAEPLRWSLIADVVPYQPGLQQKLMAYLEAFVRMSCAGAKIGDKKVDHIFKQYVKAINFISQFLEIELSEIRSICEQYCIMFNLEEHLEGIYEALTFITIHRERIEVFRHYALQISNSRQILCDPSKKLSARARQLGLVSEELQKVLTEEGLSQFL